MALLVVSWSGCSIALVASNFDCAHTKHLGSGRMEEESASLAQASEGRSQEQVVLVFQREPLRR